MLPNKASAKSSHYCASYHTGPIRSQGSQGSVFSLRLKHQPSAIRFFGQVWCLSSGTERENQINRTVDGAVLSILLTGLLPDVRYSVVVAAVTGLGVGAQSQAVSLLLSESLKLFQPFAD